MEDARANGLYIYFGSQSGTAEEFAQQLADESRDRGFAAEVLDLETFSPKDFETERVAIFLVATTGEGQPTDNALEFCRWLAASDRDSVLHSLRFAVFGLGDSTHVNFDETGGFVDSRLAQLGARRFHTRGTGDDSQDIVEDFKAWRDDVFWDALGKLLPKSYVATGTRLLRDPDVTFSRSPLQPSQPSAAVGVPADVLSKFPFKAVPATVKQVRELRRRPNVSAGFSTKHIELEVRELDALLQSAPVVTVDILPTNSDADVADILPLLGLHEADGERLLNAFIDFQPSADAAGLCNAHFKQPFPVPCTIRQALTRYCDLRRAPTRRMLSAVRAFLEARARARIDRILSDREAMKLLEDDTLRWSQAEFWATVGVHSFDLSLFLLHCPRQRPRSYTASVTPRNGLFELHFCVSLASRPVVSLRMAQLALAAKDILAPGLKLPKRSDASDSREYGLCSSWLCTRLRVGDTVSVRLRPSSFLFDKASPVIMVAAGSGVAPFRSVWLAASGKWAGRPSWTQPKAAALFFGCRHPE
eukprot:TRINITY_DN49061_c0_g1_i3.p1 TRINITY_DN49061_c0_g1~~TRINITY_DN49061_c0_g1_i3.p1  ORF type:complete len:532 (-),score=73.43 TRINITY_DN49061_c0_g1_i3:77-1672(-)